MNETGWLLRGLQAYAWLLFLLSWAQMGWIDWKEQKIRNRYLRVWLGFVALGYAALIAQSVLGSFGYLRVFIVRDYYYALLGHLGFSAAAAYALWWLRIWPAGDVKLFVLLALCYPMMRMPGSFRGGLLFLEVLINVFVPAAAFLFLTAGAYLWRTRLAAYKTHMASRAGHLLSGLRSTDVTLAPAGAAVLRASKLSASGILEALSFAGSKSQALWEPVKKELAETAAGYRAKPGLFLRDIASWLAMMTVMSMISYYLNDIVTSNVLKTLICFALMFTWSRFCQLIGTGWALGIVFCVCAAILWRHPQVNFPTLAVIFGHITLFSLFIFLGMQLAFRIIAGKTGFVFLPFVMMFFGLVPWRSMFGALWSGLGAMLAAVSLPRLPGLPSWLRLPAEGLSAPSWLAAADLSGFGIWASMGLFFGLALVFVRLWDAESYKTVPVAHLERFMTLGPPAVALIEADEDFRDEHFSAFYADGLTADQVEALKAWCTEEGIETLPIAPTISFGNWIFLGYLLTRLLDGHVLRFVY